MGSYLPPGAMKGRVDFSVGYTLGYTNTEMVYLVRSQSPIWGHPTNLVTATRPGVKLATSWS